MNLSEKIQELSEIWGKVVGVDHHKDKDIRHYIIQEYSFGNLIYKVEHYAYIGEDINCSFNTIRAAQEFLCRELISQIGKEIDFNIESTGIDSFESTMPLEYWSSLQKTFELVRNIECSDSPAQMNYEELFLEIKQKYETQNYSLKEIDKILDFHNIEKHNSEFPELERSVNYRVELLVERLKNK